MVQRVSRTPVQYTVLRHAGTELSNPKLFFSLISQDRASDVFPATPLLFTLHFSLGRFLVQQACGSPMRYMRFDLLLSMGV